MGKKLLIFTEREQLERDMLAISPEDAGLIKEFMSLLFGPDMMGAANLKPQKIRNFRDSLKMFRAILPLMGVFRKYKGVSLQEFASQVEVVDVPTPHTYYRYTGNYKGEVLGYLPTT